MPGRRVTIKDLAHRLNLSTSTVSRALANHSDVSEDTRRLVTQLATELDYHPDPSAVHLKQRRTNVIGLIIPRIVNQFFSKALGGIQQVVNEHGYTIILSQSAESLDREKKNVEIMLNNRVDGLIVSLSKETVNVNHFNKVINTETPIIFFDRVNEDLNTSKVIIDDYEASYKAVEHLVEQGCQRIANVAGPANLFTSRKRLEGYKDALRNHGLPVEEELIVSSSYQSPNVRKYTDYLLSLSSPPDAIFAINDPSAIEMMHYIKEKGLSIPKDVAVVGFNNESIDPFLDPPLSSVESPAEELGKSAAQLLFNHIQDNDLPAKCEVIKSKLVIRESSLKSKYI